MWNMLKVNNKNTTATSPLKGLTYLSMYDLLVVTSFWRFYCKLWTYFTAFSIVSTVDFEQANISWEGEYGTKLCYKASSWTNCKPRVNCQRLCFRIIRTEFLCRITYQKSNKKKVGQKRLWCHKYYVPFYSLSPPIWGMPGQ